MSDRNAINIIAESLSRKARYADDKNEKIIAIRGLARIVKESHKAAETLSFIARYSSDAEIKNAALSALAGEIY